MKKLMIAAAIACAAAFANAATAAWGVGFVEDADGNLLGSSSTGYVATFNIYSDSAMTSLLTSATASDWDSGFADGGETADVLNNAEATTYYGQIVVSHAGSTITSDGFQFTTSTISPVAEVFIMSDPSEVVGIEKIGGGAFSGTNGAFTTAGGAGASAWTAAPEPTSGLLLLLGMAGLALKRKRA